MFSYVVRCAFTKPEDRDAFLIWLCDPHIKDVCAAGALDAEIVQDDGSLSIDVRYHFPSREAFATYETEHAPRLRAEGLDAAKRLGLVPGSTIMMTRSTGEVVAQSSSSSGPS